MAVDAQSTVYLANYTNVYRVQGSAVDVYLAQPDVPSSAPTLNFYDMDRGPDGNLYISTDTAIVQSTAPHQATLFRMLPTKFGRNHIGVVSPSLNAFVPSEAIAGMGGLWLIEPQGNTMVYGMSTYALCVREVVASSGRWTGLTSPQ
jgi:hypothetical protein